MKRAREACEGVASAVLVLGYFAGVSYQMFYLLLHPERWDQSMWNDPRVGAPLAAVFLPAIYFYLRWSVRKTLRQKGYDVPKGGWR